LIKYHFNKIILIKYIIYYRGRCPKGTKRNKRTQNCEPKNRRGSPARAASPPRPAASAKRGRCPNGTRRNKRTQNCEQK